MDITKVQQEISVQILSLDSDSKKSQQLNKQTKT